MASLTQFLKQNPNARRIFGEGELKIIEKQLLGINLTQSEKNRLSRDIREKLKFIKEISRFEEKFELKKGAEIRGLIDDAVEEILNDELRKEIKEIWLFGSTIDNTRTFRSDIDVVVHFKKRLSPRDIFNFRVRISGRVSDKIDVQVFETLQEKIQKSILNNHKVIYKDG